MQNITGSFPQTRMRRNRQEPWLRDLVQETQISAKDLIWPLFVQEGMGLKTPVDSIPGVYRYSLDLIKEPIQKAVQLGIPAIALFPCVDTKQKTDNAKEAYNSDNLICRTIEAIKKMNKPVGVICDVALDPYTTHGQDGLIKRDRVDNDATLKALCKQALTQAQAGCDIVSPSDMMDGRVGAIRKALDEKGFQHVAILAYTAKYASAFYGPFRDAIGSKQALGKADKRTYQMNPANSDEAVKEALLDITEGADMIMVKPGMPYLDIIQKVSGISNTPVFAYQVSGEYAMLKAAANNGWLDFEATMIESLIALKRAGASAILTYAAPEVAIKLASQ
jgi:porphobilinogen synthase